jgi:hypothetical protein
VRRLAPNRLDVVISSDYLLSYALKQSGIDASQFNSLFTVAEKSYVPSASKDLNGGAGRAWDAHGRARNLSQDGGDEGDGCGYDAVMQCLSDADHPRKTEATTILAPGGSVGTFIPFIPSILAKNSSRPEPHAELPQETKRSALRNAAKQAVSPRT